MQNFLKATTLLFLCSACIQLPKNTGKVEVYQNVNFTAPNPNFSATSEFSSDSAWINASTGAIISYKSECPAGSQSAKQFLANISGEFYPAKTSKISSFKYNSRRALRQRIQTEIEGIPTAFDIVVLKKYGCLFLFSHSGVSKTFKSTENSFDNFLRSFKVRR